MQRGCGQSWHSSPFHSPEHPPNTSFMLWALQDLFGLLQRFSNRWKVKAKGVQSADCHDSENRSRGSRKLSCQNTTWEDSAICQVWVGEELFRALQDAQLHSVPEFAIDFGLCKKWKLPAICVKGLLRVHKEKSQAMSEHAMIPVWTLHFQKVLHPSHPEDLLRWNSVWYTLGAQWWLYIHKSLCFVMVAPARDLWK